MPLTTTSGYTFPVVNSPTTQTPNIGSPVAAGASNKVDGRTSYANWNGDYMGYLQYMAENGDASAQDKLFSYLMGEQSADRARQWTADREDSQYQRLVADLQKAGINPYVLMQNGANPISSSSSGNSYSGSQASSVANNAKTNETNIEKSLLSVFVSVLSAISVLAIAAI